MHGVLLDVDGTLVLSNEAHVLAWVEAFEKLGYAVNSDRVRSLIGMGGDKLIPLILPALASDSGEGKQISQYHSEIFLAQYAPKLQPAPGSRALVERLLKDNYKVIIATSAKPEELQVLLKAAKVDDLLEDSTTSADADHSKPAPDIIEAALEKLGVPPEHAVMIGDTPYDVEAAARAKIGLIGMRSGGFSDQDLEGAIAIYDNPADLLARYETSPLQI